MRRMPERRIIGGWPIVVAGVIAAAPPPAPPVTVASIMGAKCVNSWRADLGVTLGTGVSAWRDQVALVDYLQGTGAAQPTYNAISALNSTPSMTLDGGDDSLAATLARAAPGTTPSVIWAIVRQLSWAANDPLFNDVTAHGVVRQIGVSPALVIFCGGGANQASNTAAVINTPVRLEAQFFNSVADQLRIGSAVPVNAAASSGNVAGTGPLIGRNNTSTVFGNSELWELAFFNAAPSAGEITALNAYVTDRYGAGLV